MKSSITKLCMALVFTCACGENPVEDAASMSLSEIMDNGINLNGVTLNGVTLNGVTLNGTSLVAQRADSGATITGKDFTGVRFQVQLSSGGSAVMRIDSVDYNTTAGMYVYTVSIQGDAGWAPVCGTTNGVPVPAVPVPGTWDASSGSHNNGNNFTVACVNAAIGKCVLWGYNSWENATECSGYSCRTQSLDSWLQSCTRLVRADYCGDGVPHTRNGTPINVWDALGIQLEANTSWDLEAEWAVDGAHCIKHTRWVRADLTSPYLTDLNYVLQKCPSRLALSGREACGTESDFNTKKGLLTSTSKRKLLRNESALNQ